MDVFEAITTTRAMRRLDPARPVSDADLRTIVEAATKGPSGSNLQPVRWLVVRDADLRRQLGEVYRRVSHVLSPPAPPGTAESEPLSPLDRSVAHLVEHMGEAPVIVVPCAAGEPGRIEQAVYPAVQNLMLAARALGLGTTLTTRHRMRDAEVKAILGVPDEAQTFALIPVGYPLGRWGEATRRPLAEVMFWDRWGQTSADGSIDSV